MKLTLISFGAEIPQLKRTVDEYCSTKTDGDFCSLLKASQSDNCPTFLEFDDSSVSNFLRKRRLTIETEENGSDTDLEAERRQ
jgi:hypothetical protein